MLQRRTSTSSQSVCRRSICKSVPFVVSHMKHRGQQVRTSGTLQANDNTSGQQRFCLVVTMSAFCKQ